MEGPVTRLTTSSLTDVIALLGSKEHIVKIQVNVIRIHVKILVNVQYFRVDMSVVVKKDFEEQDARFETNVTPVHAKMVEVVLQLGMSMLAVVFLVLLERTVKLSQNAFLSTLASMEEFAMKTSEVINVLVLLDGPELAVKFQTLVLAIRVTTVEFVEA